MTLKTCWCVSTFFLGSAVAPTLLAAEPTPAPDSLLAPGLWCAEYQPEAHSCAVVRLFEARPGGTAHLRQVVVGWDRREGLQKVVLDFQVQLDGAGFCYDAGFTVIDQLGVLSRNRRKFRQPINVACPAPGRWGRPNSRVTSRHFDHGNASRTSRPDCSGLDEAD